MAKKQETKPFVDLGSVEMQPQFCGVERQGVELKIDLETQAIETKDAESIKVTFLEPNVKGFFFSGCRPGRFRIFPAIGNREEIVSLSQDNVSSPLKVRASSGFEEPACFFLQPGQRALVPIGAQFDCPSGYTIRLNNAAGVAFNYGIEVLDTCLENSWVYIANKSTRIVQLYEDTAIAEGEIVRVEQLKME